MSVSIEFTVNEEARLNTLHDLRLLDTTPSESFDRITRLASQLLRTPVSAVSLTDRNRQWFKSKVGFDASELPRHQAPCSHVIEGCGVFTVDDLRADPRFVGSPLVQAGFRFYAGAPLFTRSGYGLGALCVLDDKPRELSDSEAALLQDLAAMVMSQVELLNMIGRVDSCTGLPNQYQLGEDIEDLKLRPAARPACILVQLMSAEQAEQLGNALGLSQADIFARHVATSMKQVAGSEARLYQVAPMRCVLLFDVAPAQGTSAFLSQLRETLDQPVWCDGVPIRAEPTFGTYEFAARDVLPNDVLRRLLLATAEARRSERRHACFDQVQEDRNARRHTLLSDFASALADAGQLSLVYQPRVDLGTGHIIGVEALLRWSHPTLGPVSPGEFIPLIEQTAMAQPMTEWVAHTAMRQLRDWSRRGFELRLSINASAHNLDEPDFAERILAIAGLHGVDLTCLEIEFTESAEARDGSQVAAQLGQLRDAGVQTAIDDFGTGYSNLAYVQRLPVNVLKIDQSFIRNLETSTKDQALVRAMIGMAHQLGYHVVAEGIETLGAYRLVRSYRCNEGQGYFISRPVPAEEIAARLGDATRLREGSDLPTVRDRPQGARLCDSPATVSPTAARASARYVLGEPASCP